MSKFRLFLKKNLKPVISSRVFIISALFVVLFLVVLIRLFGLQIINGKEYQENFRLKILKTQEVKSTRGNIYDKNGYPLAYNELAYSVTIEDNGIYDVLTNKEKNNALNGNIRQILNILDMNGDTEVTYLYINIDEDGNYAFTQSEGTSRNRFIADVYGEIYFDDLKPEQKNATADDIMEYLCSERRYNININEIGKELALRIVNIRFAMSQVSFSKYLVTTVAKDVCDNTVTMIKEDSEKLNGVGITADYLRKYNDAEYFAPVIGYTGLMSAEEYEEYTEKDDSYSYNDVIGKSGIEKSMESVLKGTKGERSFYIDNVGTVLETTEVVDPIPGGDLYLTIDKDLQIAAYKMLEQELAGIILKQLVNEMEYDPHNVSNTYLIQIPVGDVYNALIDNSVLNINKFKDAETGSEQQITYDLFIERQKEAVNASVNELINPSGTYQEIPNELKAYTSFIAGKLFKSTAQIIDPNRIDTTDEIYQAWNNDGSISMREYIDHAISKDWIDTSKLNEYVDSSSLFYDSSEVLKALCAYLNDKLYTSTDFSKLVYKYMIIDGTLPARSLCMMLYEQGVLSSDDTLRDQLEQGSIDPYNFIRQKIYSLEITPAMLALEPCSGSIVVTNPNNGNVLALVSYPGYDNNRLSNNMDSEYYNKLVRDKSIPLYNYATQEKFAPGSTYKMVTASAGLEEGVITEENKFVCTGIFDKIQPSAKCWAYPLYHGEENVVNAIRDSCNVFFFEVGYALSLDQDGNYSTNQGIETLKKYASLFGFDEVSGVELQEAEPQISDYDSVRSSIGQGTNNYTCTQIARYISTIANKGTVYNLTLLDKLLDQNGKMIENYEADIKNKIEFKDSTWESLQEGMHLMAQGNDNLSTATYSYNISSAGKTGTAEQSSIHPDNVTYVGFAPFENPEIAFSVRIAHGYTSAYTAQIANDILMYYFNVCEPELIIPGVANDVNSAARSD